MYKKFFAFFTLLTLWFIPVGMVNAKESFPKPVGFVNDLEGVLGDTSELENKLSSFEEKTGIEIAVVTVEDFDGFSIERYANDLFTDWGIGKKEKDNGVLILVSVKQRKARIEVGYGLEEFLPDAFVGNILDYYMKPAFKEGSYLEGINNGVDEIIKRLENHDYQLTTNYIDLESVYNKNERSDLLSVLVLVGIIVMFSIFIFVFNDKFGFMGGVTGFVVALSFSELLYSKQLLFLYLLIETVVGFLLSLFKTHVLNIKGGGNSSQYTSKPFRHSSYSSSSSSWSRSSSSSSGFSFGGGSSGGGGASSSW